MTDDPNSPLIVSASRTKDMVRRSPDLLGGILLGKAPCRWGPQAPFGMVDPSNLHTVVLWTKDPQNLLYHNSLRETLHTLHSKYHVQISIQVTATGLGGSFIEPGIPHWKDLLICLSNLFTQDWIDPAVVVYRYDPFLSIRTPSGKIISNARIGLFKTILGEFAKLGIRRVTTSRADAMRYPPVAKRIQMLGLEWIHIDDATAEELCKEMDAVCRAKHLDFSVCCEPSVEFLLNRWGCIDANWLNRTKGEQFPQATKTLHNKIGKQRPACRCTYSRDVGYSTGSATCYSGGYGCLYCYSQGNAKPPNIEAVLNEIHQFDTDPEGYLTAKNLPLELHIEE